MTCPDKVNSYSDQLKLNWVCKFRKKKTEILSIPALQNFQLTSRTCWLKLTYQYQLIVICLFVCKAFLIIYYPITSIRITTHIENVNFYFICLSCFLSSLFVLLSSFSCFSLALVLPLTWWGIRKLQEVILGHTDKSPPKVGRQPGSLSTAAPDQTWEYIIISALLMWLQESLWSGTHDLILISHVTKTSFRHFTRS